MPSLKKKQILPVYIILYGINSMVLTMLIVGSAITLFTKDPSGFSATYLELANLLGVSCAGIIGSFVLKHFSSYTIGIGTLLCASFILLCLRYSNINVDNCTITIGALSCILTIEYANSLSFINKQIGDQVSPFFWSTLQIFWQFFNVLAPIGAKTLLTIFSFKTLLLFCTFSYILRMLPWKLLCAVDPDLKEVEAQPSGILTGFKELIQSPGLLHMTSFRIINYIGMVSYTISLPILVARIANGNSQINAQLHSYSLSIINLGFILSGVCGSWILKRKPKFIIYFFKISPIVIVLVTIVAFYVIQSLHLQITAFLYGMGLYLFRTAFAIISQALTKKNKLAHTILAGDVLAKSFAYAIGSLIPFWIVLPPIWGIVPPLVGCVSCSLFSLVITKPIVKIYLATLCKENTTK